MFIKKKIHLKISQISISNNVKFIYTILYLHTLYHIANIKKYCTVKCQMYLFNNFKIHLVKETNLHMESTAKQSKLVYSKIIWIIESVLKRELSSLQD